MLVQTIRTRAGQALSIAGILILLISLSMLVLLISVSMLVLTLGFAAEFHPIISKYFSSPTIWLAGIAFSFLIMGLGEAVTILNDIRTATVSSVARERLQGN